ncbi:MAG TPA: hypothetical protein VGP92_15940 [Acidimicrobiia bacterium]|nr:hypothetical protein [Acidimicrobiia bacterium]
MSRAYRNPTDPDQTPSGSAKERSPWVRHTGRPADIDLRILSDRTENGGTVTRLVDRHGKRLNDEAIVGRPGREDEVALVIAEKVTELLREQ